MRKITKHTSKLQKLKETGLNSSAPFQNLKDSLSSFDVTQPMRNFKLSVDEDAKLEWYSKLVN